MENIITKKHIEEDIIGEDVYDYGDEMLDDDCIDPIEAAFMQGYKDA